MAMFISYVSLPQGISENDLTCAGNKLFDFWEPLMNVAWITMKKWLHWLQSLKFQGQAARKSRRTGDFNRCLTFRPQNNGKIIGHRVPKKPYAKFGVKKLGVYNRPEPTQGGTTTQEHDPHTRTVPTKRTHDWEFAHYSDWIAGSQSSWHSSATRYLPTKIGRVRLTTHIASSTQVWKKLCSQNLMVGGWATPLKNRKVNWDDLKPNISGKIKLMFQTTNQTMVFGRFPFNQSMDLL